MNSAGPYIIQRRRTCRWIMVMAVAAVLLDHTAAFSQNKKEVEHRLKAVYLLNFLQFIEWPDSVIAEDHSPIMFSVVGNDPFGSILDETFRDETFNGHPVVVSRHRTVNELGRCHMLFISSSQKNISKEMLKNFNEASTLTVSDLDDFAAGGGSIGFYLENNKVKFEINVASLKQGNLKASSKLLRLAKIVTPL